MNKITILILNLILCANLSAQERFFEFILGWSCSHIEETDNGYITIGADTLGNSFYDHTIISNQLNYEGEFIDSYETALDTTASLSILNRNQISAMYSDGYIVAGRLQQTDEITIDPFLIWYNSNMTEVLNYRVFDFSYTASFLTISAVNDTTVIVGGIIQPTTALYAHATLINLDMEGNIRWQQNYPCGTNCIRVVQQVLPTSDGGYILACTEQIEYIGSSTFDWFSHGIFIKTDSLGIEEWTISPGDDGNYLLTPGGVVETDDGNILISYSNHKRYNNLNGNGSANTLTNDTATVYIEKYSLENGSLIWQNSLINEIPLTILDDGRGYHYKLTQMLPTTDDNILITGTTNLGAILIKTTQEGEFLWFREHMPYDWASNENTADFQETKAYGTTETSDGGFIIGGEYISSPGNIYPNLFQSAFALKVDEYGCLEPGCHLTDNIPELENDYSKLDIYPNPTQSEITINFPTKESGLLQVTDIMGKLICEYTLNDIQQYIISLDSNKAGMYLFRFVCESGEVYVGKVVKE